MQAVVDNRAARWIEASTDNLGVAVITLSRTPHLACFHAQQSVEKALKALLTRLDGDAPQVNLARLLVSSIEAHGEVVDKDIADAALDTDKYYIGPRYPDAIGFADASLMFGAGDAARAIDAARAVQDWFRGNWNAWLKRHRNSAHAENATCPAVLQ